MADDDLVRCMGCGELFVLVRAATGPARRYCRPACRQRALRERAHLEVVVEAADLALDCTHSQLSEVLANLPPSAAEVLRDALRARTAGVVGAKRSDRNLSLAGGDALCTSDTNAAGAGVAGIHNAKER